MSRKVMQYIIAHPWKCLTSFAIFLIIFAITISKLPEIVAVIIGICLVVLMIATIITSIYQEKKEKQKVCRKEQCPSL